MESDAKQTNPRAVPLWPDAGQRLGLGRCNTYKLAENGEIPTLPFSRGKKMVSTAWLDKVLSAAPET